MFILLVAAIQLSFTYVVDPNQQYCMLYQITEPSDVKMKVAVLFNDTKTYNGCSQTRYHVFKEITSLNMSLNLDATIEHSNKGFSISNVYSNQFQLFNSKLSIKMQNSNNITISTFSDAQEVNLKIINTLTQYSATNSSIKTFCGLATNINNAYLLHFDISYDLIVTDQFSGISDFVDELKATSCKVEAKVTAKNCYGISKQMNKIELTDITFQKCSLIGSSIAFGISFKIEQTSLINNVVFQVNLVAPSTCGFVNQIATGTTLTVKNVNFDCMIDDGGLQQNNIIVNQILGTLIVSNVKGAVRGAWYEVTPGNTSQADININPSINLLFDVSTITCVSAKCNWKAFDGSFDVNNTIINLEDSEVNLPLTTTEAHLSLFSGFSIFAGITVKSDNLTISVDNSKQLHFSLLQITMVADTKVLNCEIDVTMYQTGAQSTLTHLFSNITNKLNISQSKFTGYSKVLGLSSLIALQQTAPAFITNSELKATQTSQGADFGGLLYSSSAALSIKDSDISMVLRMDGRQAFTIGTYMFESKVGFSFTGSGNTVAFYGNFDATDCPCHAGDCKTLITPFTCTPTTKITVAQFITKAVMKDANGSSFQEVYALSTPESAIGTTIDVTATWPPTDGYDVGQNFVVSIFSDIQHIESVSVTSYPQSFTGVTNFASVFVGIVHQRTVVMNCSFNGDFGSKTAGLNSDVAIIAGVVISSLKIHNCNISSNLKSTKSAAFFISSISSGSVEVKNSVAHGPIDGSGNIATIVSFVNSSSTLTIDNSTVQSDIYDHGSTLVTKIAANNLGVIDYKNYNVNKSMIYVVSYINTISSCLPANCDQVDIFATRGKVVQSNCSNSQHCVTTQYNNSAIIQSGTFVLSSSSSLFGEFPIIYNVYVTNDKTQELIIETKYFGGIFGTLNTDTSIINVWYDVNNLVATSAIAGGLVEHTFPKALEIKNSNVTCNFQVTSFAALVSYVFDSGSVIVNNTNVTTTAIGSQQTSGLFNTIEGNTKVQINNSFFHLMETGHDNACAITCKMMKGSIVEINNCSFSGQTISTTATLSFVGMLGNCKDDGSGINQISFINVSSNLEIKSDSFASYLVCYLQGAITAHNYTYNGSITGGMFSGGYQALADSSNHEFINMTVNASIVGSTYVGALITQISGTYNVILNNTLFNITMKKTENTSDDKGACLIAFLSGSPTFTFINVTVRHKTADDSLLKPFPCPFSSSVSISGSVITCEPLP